MSTGVPHPRPISGASYSAVELSLANDAVILLDQRKLPGVEEYVVIGQVSEVAHAIKSMTVRGAPAIGITAAYAMVLAARRAGKNYIKEMKEAGDQLKATRPTAVNLAWAIDKMLKRVESQSSTIDSATRVEELADLARSIHREDVKADQVMGKLGASRIADGMTILTHCNAGAIATGGYGTALGVIRAAHETGKSIKVLADETRPLLQGARLTAWELQRDGIEVELITDACAGHLFARKAIDLALVGSDRIAANGDVANKIGTYSVACLAKHHQRPFYVAAPWSTVDLDCSDGLAIPIEERGRHEVTHLAEQELAPTGIGVRNPTFDVTPSELVTAIFTERGVIEPVNAESLRACSQPGGR